MDSAEAGTMQRKTTDEHRWTQILLDLNLLYSPQTGSGRNNEDEGRGRGREEAWSCGKLLLSMGLGAWGFVTSAAELSPAQFQFFENKIRPVLAENCYKDHSVQAEKVKAA